MSLPTSAHEARTLPNDRILDTLDGNSSEKMKLPDTDGYTYVLLISVEVLSALTVTSR